MERAWEEGCFIPDPDYSGDTPDAADVKLFIETFHLKHPKEFKRLTNNYPKDFYANPSLPHRLMVKKNATVDKKKGAGLKFTSMYSFFGVYCY